MVMPSKELQKAIKQFRALKDEDLTCPSASWYMFVVRG
jgi:hypothetical protein